MADPYIKTAKRVTQYAERVFAESGQTKWPTVRETARACRVSQADIREFCSEGVFGLMSTAYNVHPTPAWGDHFVEVCV